jgi:hypothetical protein
MIWTDGTSRGGPSGAICWPFWWYVSHAGAQLGLAYGSDPRQKLDILPAGPENPVLAFNHGGSLMEAQ